MIDLTYVVSSKNRVDRLSELLRDLCANKRSCDEVIVVDGDSNDGTVEVVRRLVDSGDVNVFVSEADAGEAHALNKGMLLAQGELIKVLTDDDVFNWRAIRDCCSFMLAQPEIEVLGSNGLGTDYASDPIWVRMSYEPEYREWLASGTPFDFSGLGLLIRRAALPHLGLFHSSLTYVDYEYTLRITSARNGLAWYTGFVWARLAHADSATQRSRAVCTLDKQRVRALYGLPQEPSEEEAAAQNAVRGVVRKSRAALRSVVAPGDRESLLARRTRDWGALVLSAQAALAEAHRTSKATFLW